LISPLQSPGVSLTQAVAAKENSRAVAEIPAAGSGSTVSTSSDAGAETTAAAAGGREDLSVFFSIGVVVDVLLVTVFLVWAVGQWRKTKK